MIGYISGGSEKEINVKVEELFWGNNVDQLKPPFDVIFGSDIIYEIQAFESLVKCIKV